MAEHDEQKHHAGRAAREAVQETEPKKEAESYPLHLLIDGGITDYPSHVVAGALAGLPGNRKNLTIEEANAACAAWLDAPVKEA
jgi:hypothetical protein